MTESSVPNVPSHHNPLQNIRVVLVEPQGPLNIGSVCRAMKNFGLRNLWLVRPGCDLGTDAIKMALSARDILESAHITKDLHEALRGSILVLGTSNRRGDYHDPHMVMEEGMELLGKSLRYGPISIVFGREEWGLTQEDLRLCQGTIRVLTDPAFSSLNLAQAVLLVAYEIFKNFGDKPEIPNPHANDPYEFPPNHEELQSLFEHMMQVLRRCHLLPRTNPDGLMQVIRTFIHRARAKRRETNLLHGIFSNLNGFMKKYHLLPEEKIEKKDYSGTRD